MTGRDFLTGLVTRVLILAAAVPAAATGLLALAGSARFGVGFFLFLVGIPLWTFCASLVLWRLLRTRLASIEWPRSIALIVIPLFCADWRFFLWMFKPFHAPFLVTVVLLLMLLALWPDRNERIVLTGQLKAAATVLGCCLAVQVLVSLIALAGSIASIFITSHVAFRLEWTSKSFAAMWDFAIAAAMIWTLIEARRSSGDTVGGNDGDPIPRSLPPTPMNAAGVTFGKR